MSEADGTLLNWRDVAVEEDWQILLLGNGLSINVWERFAYTKLFDHAVAADLTEEDGNLFSGTTNFELVLAELNTAIRVCDVIGIDTGPLYARYRSIQQALGHAVRRVHPIRSQIPNASISTIRKAIEDCEWVFTTSYDLLLYWAMGHRGYAPFKDHFRYAGRCEFDPKRTDVYEGEIPVYYLHGALHLVVTGSGVTLKRTTRGLQTLLDQYGQPIAGDPQARPLLVTEGSWEEKMTAIEGNDYLTHCLDLFSKLDFPLVVFGSSLSQQDEHLVGAISEYPDRPVAVSMMRRPKAELLAQQSQLYNRMGVEEVYFYDAATHPLGSPTLRVPLT